MSVSGDAGKTFGTKHGGPWTEISLELAVGSEHRNLYEPFTDLLHLSLEIIYWMLEKPPKVKKGKPVNFLRSFDSFSFKILNN